MKHNYKCDICGKKAKYNTQDQNIIYEIDNNGDFIEIDSSFNGDNEFFCENHY